jgi:chromosome segregation ATPase
VPAQRYSPARDWLALCLLTFGIGFTVSLPLHRNLQQSALTALAAVPGAAVSISLLRRQRERLLSRKLMPVKAYLGKAQQQERVLRANLQLLEQTHRATAQQVQQLETVKKNLTQNIASYDSQSRTMEQHQICLRLKSSQHHNLTAETDILQKQQKLAQLDGNIISQKNLIDGLKLEISQLSQEQKAIQKSAIVDQVELVNVHQQITQYFATQSELKINIETLQSSLDWLETEIADKKVAAEHLEADLFQLHQQQLKLANAVVDLEAAIAEKQALIHEKELTCQNLDQQIEQSQADHNHLSGLVASMNQSIAQKQALFLEIDCTISGHETLRVECETEISRLQESINQLRLQLSDQQKKFSPAQVQSTRSELNPQQLEVLNSTNTEWYGGFEDNPHLMVLLHIEKHGAITEAEASSILGNPRSVRQFANRLSEYSQHLPFAIRVELSASGSRYLKQSDHS